MIKDNQILMAFYEISMDLKVRELGLQPDLVQLGLGPT